MIVDGAHSVAGDLSQTEFTPMRIDFARLLLLYQCGISALTTKVNILKGELTHIDHDCPIQHVTSRVKSPDSILGKAARIGCPLSVDDIRANILDIAGVRVICGLISDTYRIATMLSQRADVTVIEVEDYIAHPKPNGYKSLHMIIEIPVYLSDRVERVPVELQIRTIAMDFWAGLERKIYYKFERAVPRRLLNELTDAADAAHRLDMMMERLHDEVADLVAGPGRPRCSPGPAAAKHDRRLAALPRTVSVSGSTTERRWWASRGVVTGCGIEQVGGHIAAKTVRLRSRTNSPSHTHSDADRKTISQSSHNPRREAAHVRTNSVLPDRASAPIGNR
jgi:putative GTP pyrophosphokinase